MKYEGKTKEELIKLLEEKDKLIDKLNYYATRDHMTNLLNRRAGIDILKEKISISNIKGNNLTVCFVDVDKLKKVNDTFGHKEGDRLLIKVSKLIRNNIRESDMVIRIGGDEFLVILPNITKKEVNKIWDRICANVSKENKQGRCKYNISLSYGFSEYFPGSEVSIEDLIKKADIEMYKKKEEKNYNSTIIV